MIYWYIIVLCIKFTSKASFAQLELIQVVIQGEKTIRDILGYFDLGYNKVLIIKSRRLEKALGLQKGSLNKGFRIIRIEDISSQNIRLPTIDIGNEYFRPNRGLPGGGPEYVIDSISTRR